MITLRNIGQTVSQQRDAVSVFLLQKPRPKSHSSRLIFIHPSLNSYSWARTRSRQGRAPATAQTYPHRFRVDATGAGDQCRQLPNWFGCGFAELASLSCFTLAMSGPLRQSSVLFAPVHLGHAPVADGPGPQGQGMQGQGMQAQATKQDPRQTGTRPRTGATSTPAGDADTDTDEAAPITRRGMPLPSAPPPPPSESSPAEASRPRRPSPVVAHSTAAPHSTGSEAEEVPVSRSNAPASSNELPAVRPRALSIPYASWSPPAKDASPSPAGEPLAADAQLPPSIPPAGAGTRAASTAPVPVSRSRSTCKRHGLARSADGKCLMCEKERAAVTSSRSWKFLLVGLLATAAIAALVVSFV